MTMRSTEFDILKGLMMITVVMGHAGVLLPWNIEFSPTFTLYSMFFLLYKQLRLTQVVPVYYRFSL